MRRFCARLAVFVVVVFLLGSAILALSPTDERKTPRSGVVDELVVQDKGGEKGLKSPRVIKEVEPRYTDDALRAGTRPVQKVREDPAAKIPPIGDASIDTIAKLPAGVSRAACSKGQG